MIIKGIVFKTAGLLSRNRKINAYFGNLVIIERIKCSQHKKVNIITQKNK